MKNQEVKTENCTIVNGVMLTDKAIDRLQEMQAHNNESLENSLRIIKDAVFLLARHYDDFKGEELDKVNYLKFELTFVYDNFKELARP